MGVGKDGRVQNDACQYGHSSLSACRRTLFAKASGCSILHARDSVAHRPLVSDTGVGSLGVSSRYFALNPQALAKLVPSLNTSDRRAVVI